jgi:hypothetical protein
MDEDRYMDADEALAWGFATKVLAPKAKPVSMGDAKAAVRAMFEQMKAEARARLMSRSSALLVSTSSDTQGLGDASATGPDTQPPVGKENDMDSKLILAALGLPEGATPEQVSAFATQARAATTERDALLQAIGADSIDAAKGTLAALKGATERAEKAEAELAAEKTKTEKQERDQIVAKLRAEGKVTPAQEKDLLPTLNLAGLKAFAATAPKVLGKSDRREPGSGPVTSDGAETWRGKTYAELSNRERADLHAEDAELFNRMRDHAVKARKI